MKVLDAAFGHPRGLSGRVGGIIMARGNAEQERWAVRQAGLRPDARVLVVGHGPGIGVAMAAAAVRPPSGHVVGVDPSSTMRAMAAERCSSRGVTGHVELREGRAERTHCCDTSMDVAISVNNIMLWDRAAGFAELHRVLKPGGRLVVTVHRHVLDTRPEQLRTDAVAAGFVNVEVALRQRRLNSPAVDLRAQRAQVHDRVADPGRE
ncbi:class I SAM-dependent methyltransferase [Halopolyspora algeriensis]|nr:methyltransferase domain-containing protein [Halopolyspora algeriensis]